MAYNQLEKLMQNIDAIGIALQWDGTTQLSSQEGQRLSLYSGFGGLKQILFPEGPPEAWKAAGASQADMGLYEQTMELHRLLQRHLSVQEYQESIDSLKNSVLTAFYTPKTLPDTLYSALWDAGIQPKSIYDPSAGLGVFLTRAEDSFPTLEKMKGIEKDLITGRVLKAYSSTWFTSSNIDVKPFEHTGKEDEGKYDLVVSNIPFGNFTVYDPDMADQGHKQSIHNYFFVKGMEKVRDGGILAFLTTSGFLNSYQNGSARRHLLSQGNFVSLAALPDNLMKDSANVEAPTHLLIFQKNVSKQELSPSEMLLTEVVKGNNEFGEYAINAFLAQNEQLYIGDEQGPGKNQYGQAHHMNWMNASLDSIEAPLYRLLSEDFALRLNVDLFNSLELAQPLIAASPTARLTYLSQPADQVQASTVQLGLFDTLAPEKVNRPQAYISPEDARTVAPISARFISVIRTQDNPEHESIVIVAAKHRKAKRYIYRMHSNVAQVKTKSRWLNSDDLSKEIERVSEALRGFDHKYLYEGERETEHQLNLNPIPPNEFKELLPHHQENSLVFHNGAVGHLEQVDHAQGNAIFHGWKDQQDVEFYERYIGLRDTYIGFAALDLQKRNRMEREQLNSLYDSFVVDFKQLNSNANAKRIGRDEVHGNLILSSLERREGNGFTKSDVLTGSLVARAEEFRTELATEALAKTLNDLGRVDMVNIARITGRPSGDLIEELRGHIIFNPGTDIWETRDAYLSGNVFLKLEIARAKCQAEPENTEYQRSLAEIEKVQPEQVPFELLDFNLGERWIPIEFYNRFASDFFDQDVRIQFIRSSDIFKVESPERSAKMVQEYSITPKSGRTVFGNLLLENALENTSPYFSYEVPDGPDKVKRIPDNDAIQLAHQKIESIRSAFVDWLRGISASDQKALTDLYNNTFNCYVLREYNGGHQTFPGLDKQGLGIQDLYSSQKDACWRIIQNRGALIDHEVGLGKTLTMIIASHEMKRLGIIHKPLIIALKANVGDIAATYRKAYPNARLLYPGKDDFTPSKRLRVFHEIKNNNWDCIILTHDQFLKIPQSDEIQTKIFQEELNNTERDLQTVKNLGGSISRSMLKGLEIRKNNLLVKLKAVEKAIESKKDSGIDFLSMGIDHLFVDEAHKFKNLTFTTRHERVAGLGNTQGSLKALNMLFAVRTLQDKYDSDLCATFLSGTPISNSLTELYLIFKYLRPRELERQRIENFDGWAAVFAKKTTDFEFSVTNEIIAKERFRHFIKVPELQVFYNEITDYKTAQHIKLDKPAIDEMLINISPSSDQEYFTSQLIAFAKTGDARLIGREPLSESEDKGRMLIATNYAKKMATDMRLIDDRLYSDDHQNKVNTCARYVRQAWLGSTKYRGTQIVFCDIGTPKPDQFNIYDALKFKLTEELQIPSHEITFIHDWSDARKPELFRKMNNGEIRILLGSTEKAGTGLNVQKRMVAMHHIDIPWKPSELEQRNGRGARQGNWAAKEFNNNKIQNLIYATEKSLDNYKFNLLKNKQTFISQMKNNELNVRSIDEGAMDEKSGMNFAEYTAILSGDTSLLEKTRLEKKVASMESLRTAHFRQVHTHKGDLQRMAASLAAEEKLYPELLRDENCYKSQLTFDKDGTKCNPVKLFGLSSTDPERIGSYLIDMSRNWKAGEKKESKEKIGSLYGFDLYIQKSVSGSAEFEKWKNLFYAQHPQGSVKYTSNNGAINEDFPKGAARNFISAIDKVSVLRERTLLEIEEKKEYLPKLREIISKPFEKETELNELKTELGKLQKAILEKLSKIDSSSAGTGEEQVTTLPNSTFAFQEHGPGQDALKDLSGQDRQRRPMRL
ncbi:N-6 DNA methylase [Pedobacter paludis]|uniref:DNA methylase n=1 Tax=Pedobacter paludis TaxID=2203212 RepID=A0A317EZ27_9SPHI|nr:N-6 DNA methylase [Pedobacter paludis]PWS32230.1 DNA methylase [Pedobacter paludis]